MSKNFRRLGAAIAATAIALVGAVTVAAPAHAANVDPDELGSINITKLVQPGGVLPTTPGDVTTAPVGAEGVGGVEFTVYQVSVNGVPIDLTTPEGWDQYETLQLAYPGGNPTQTQLNTAPYSLSLIDADTSADGTGIVPAFTGLDLSVYFVVEDASANPEVIEESAPFLVSVPMPSVVDNTWIYDVYVYPKNITTEFGKTFDAAGARGLGEDVEWTITGVVPQLADGDLMTEFGIDDTLSTNLTYVSAAMTLTDPDGTTIIAVDPALYTITPAPATTVTLEFVGPAGLALLDANPGATVAFTITTEVTSLSADGEIDNVGTLRINGVPRVTPPASTYWGAILITKTDDAATPVPLEGAVFEVFASQADARARNNPIIALPNSNPTQSQYVTDEDGLALIPGLLTDVTTPATYWVREVVAPIGYQLPAAIDLTGTDADPAIDSVIVTPNGTTVDPVDLEVENTQVAAWLLPLTGGGGQTAFLIAGGALLVVAAGAAVFFTARRRKAHATA